MNIDDSIRHLEAEKKQIQEFIAKQQRRLADIDIELAILLNKQAEAISEEENQTYSTPSLIIPDRLGISGYNAPSTIYNQNLASKKLVDFDYVCSISSIAGILTYIGKELILIKSDEELSEESKSLLDQYYERLRLLPSIIRCGDTMMETKIVNYLYTIHSPLKNPFDNKPVDFIPDNNCNVIDNVFAIIYFINNWHQEIEKFEIKGNPQYLIESDDKFYSKISCSKMDLHAVALFNSIYELRKVGYKVGIVPITNKRIFFRSSTEASNERFVSCFYNPNYVGIDDDGSIIDERELNRIGKASYSSHHGLQYVSGHYRSGHFRNGHWVSGGYVNGHYRLR